MTNYIGIDIGGSKIFAIRANNKLKIEKRILEKTSKERNSFEKILFHIIDSIITKDTKAIGVAWPGTINPKTGNIINTPNIPKLNKYPLKKILEKRYSLPVSIDNDSKLFALGESSGKTKCFLGIILGTGVGCGIIVNGKIFSGEEGHAGEIGHTYLDPYKKISTEDLFSGKGINNYLKNKKSLTKITRLMSIWIYNLIMTFNPKEIIFGGGIGQNILPRFIKKVEKNVKKLVKEKGFSNLVKLQISKKENSGALGALRLAMQNNN